MATDLLATRTAVYELLPAFIRSRDEASAAALKELMTIVGDQATALQRDLDRMYDGWFIETCDEWLIPYIADLLGLEPAHLAAGAGNGTGCQTGPARAQVLSARGATANAIAHRRRKGTAWILEELARDFAHWPARAVELYRQVIVASHLDHLQPSRPATADIHSARMLEDLNGPLDSFRHLTDVRRVSDAESRGRYSAQNVALFVWRLRPYKVTHTIAYCREEAGMHCFTFSALGHDTQLFRAPSPELERKAIARSEHLPVPITALMLERDAPADASPAPADPVLYGNTASLAVFAANWPTPKEGGIIPPDKVIPADLSDWSYKVPKGHVAVDPVRGRISFPTSQAPRHEVKVTYHYGFAMDIGGGEYSRSAVPLPPDAERISVSPDPRSGATTITTVADVLTQWRTRNPAPPAHGDRRALVIELSVSGLYKGRFNLSLFARETVAVIAAPGTRPVLWLSDESPGSPDAISIRGRRGSRVILDGLLISGRAIEVGNGRTDEDEHTTGALPGDDDLCEVWIRHSTLVPGNSLLQNCDPRRPSEPSLIIEDTSACIRLESSIVGAIRVLHEDLHREAAHLQIADTIVDATGADRVAIGGIADGIARAELTVSRSTIVGRVAVHAIRLAEDNLFVSPVTTARRQAGCVRFSYVPAGSRTPRRYECEPDGALQQVATDIQTLPSSVSPVERDALRAAWEEAAVLRVAPQFDSVRYGTASYLRLAECTDARLTRGAHDESEMGVYHDLFEPQRLSMLTDRLSEFVPASCESAVVFAS